MLARPHGGRLINNELKGQERKHALEEANRLYAVTIDDDYVSDVRNIARGVFSPLEGFMTKEAVLSTAYDMKLPSGVPFTIPIILDVDKTETGHFTVGDSIALQNQQGDRVAVMEVEGIFDFDRRKVAKAVFQTDDPKHPGVANLLSKKECFVGGRVLLLDNSKKPIERYNLEPKETRILFREKGWKSIVAFQTRNPIHRAHEYLQRCALEVVDGLFINPLIGRKKQGDFKDQLILASYETMMAQFYPKNRVAMAILPTRMNYAGPKEAIHHAIMRKNFGCTHFIVGRDHAGVGNYYGTFDAQEIFEQFPDLGIEPLKFEHSFYCRKCLCFATAKTCSHGKEDRTPPSGSLIRELITKKEIVPDKIMRKEISELLISFDHPFVE